MISSHNTNVNIVAAAVRKAFILPTCVDVTLIGHFSQP